jgi:hypothetical protein
MTAAQDGGKVVSLTQRPPLPPGITPELSLDLMNSICVFQERLLLIINPRNFVSFTLLIFLSSYVICMSEEQDFYL